MTSRTTALAIGTGTGKHARAARNEARQAIHAALSQETGKPLPETKPSLWSLTFPRWLEALSA